MFFLTKLNNKNQVKLKFVQWGHNSCLEFKLLQTIYHWWIIWKIKCTSTTFLLIYFVLYDIMASRSKHLYCVSDITTPMVIINFLWIFFHLISFTFYCKFQTMIVSVYWGLQIISKFIFVVLITIIYTSLLNDSVRIYN